MDLLTGHIYRTCSETGGPVELLSIEPAPYCRQLVVVVRYLEDHPDGHKKGEVGRLFSTALRDPQFSGRKTMGTTAG